MIDIVFMNMHFESFIEAVSNKGKLEIMWQQILLTREISSFIVIPQKKRTCFSRIASRR